VIQAPNGANVTDGDHELLMIDLTGLFNADTRAPLMAVVEEQCDLLCWHQRTSGHALPFWSSDLDA
jgi:hypothetical protein